MITAREIEKYRDAYEPGMTVSELVEFFQDCQKSAPEDEEFAAYTVEDLRELAEKIVTYMIHNKEEKDMAQERIWYAVLQSNEDDDWGHGSRDLEEAKEMVRAYREDGYPDAYIAVIDDITNPVCLEEIREF